MAERPYSRYTRARTWAAVYSQHINAGYALVPYSATNNSIDVISCKDMRNNAQDLAKDTQDMASLLLGHAEECANYYAQRKTPDQAPAVLAEVIEAKRWRSAVVLTRSSDYYYYHLEDHIGFHLVICGLHDSYLHLPVWEMRTNQRYRARETAVALASPEFERMRCTQVGHTILVAAYAKSDQAAVSFVRTLPQRTQSRLHREKDELQAIHHRGRPLAFLTEAERRAIGSKISQGLRRYHEQRRLHVI